MRVGVIHLGRWPRFAAIDRPPAGIILGGDWTRLLKCPDRVGMQPSSRQLAGTRARSSAG